MNALAPNKMISTSNIPCFHCNKTVKLGKMRQHAGEHILDATRHGNGEIGLMPCGFCGRDGHCLTQLQIGRRGAVKVASTCQYKYENVKYPAESESTDDSPCTNLLIYCPLCPKSASGEPKTIWKYNAVYHRIDAHPTQQTPVGFLKMFFISALEEGRVGIKVEKTHEFRREKRLPEGSDDLQSMDTGGFLDPLGLPSIPTSQGRTREETLTQTNFTWLSNR